MRMKNYLISTPNPTEDNFTLSINSDLDNALLEIFNILGERIFTKKLYNRLEIVNCKEFLSGIYIIKLSIEGKIHMQKLIVNK